MSTYATDGTVGVDVTEIRTSASGPSHTTGTRVTLDQGGGAMYVYANSAIAQFNFVICRTSGASALMKYKAENLTTARALINRGVAVAQTSIAANSYGWVHTKGAGIRGKAAASCQPSVLLYTTATEGVVDDATVSAGLVAGLVATTSAASASAPTIFAGVDLQVSYH